jgi:hypothetical protein
MTILNNPWFIVRLALVLTVLGVFVPVHKSDRWESADRGCSMMHQE